MPELCPIQQRHHSLQGWAQTFDLIPLMLGIAHSWCTSITITPESWMSLLPPLSAPCYTHVTPLASKSVEPRSHACTVAARESRKVTFYLVEQQINHMGNIPSTIRSSVVWGSQKKLTVSLDSSTLFFKINTTPVNHLHRLVLLTITGHTSHSWLAYIPQLRTKILPNIKIPWANTLGTSIASCSWHPKQGCRSLSQRKNSTSSSS